jgi:mRNA-degrading endonuclease toxin of MazEF toxin-antitoxin module
LATRGKKEKEYPPMPANWMYKRGDVYMMDLNPYSGSEQGGIRPAIVVQNDDGNFYSNVLLVVPLTTQIKKRNMPTHFILHNRFLSAPSMAICESPRPADKSRVLSYLGHLSKYEMRQVSVCLQYSFGFIGYKSFRKYLTAPPQEDVLAAAKELLSQQFQNLRVLNSQPPALAKHTKGDLHSIEQISERMLSPPRQNLLLSSWSQNWMMHFNRLCSAGISAMNGIPVSAYPITKRRKSV